jgi:hypothetical protein
VSELLPLWRSGGAESRPHLLAEDATFSSPVTEYHGRAEAAYMLGLIARVLDIVEQGSGWHTDTETVSAFTARVGRDQVQGMLREQHDETDCLTQLTLFLRPYSTSEKPSRGCETCLARARYPAANRERRRVGNPWRDGDRPMSLGSCGSLTW